MKEIRTRSTSRVTAEATDIVLRESESIRLIFRPTILDNRNNVDAAVKGVFLYQRKSKKANWEDFETIPLNSVKVGEGYKLELKSAELLRLIQELKPLYDLHKEGGVPRGEKKYVQATPQLQQLAELTSHDTQKFLNANTAIGSSLLSKLLNWAINLEDPSPIIERLVELNPESLNKLNAALGMQRLKNAIKIWENNENNPDEEFWQKSLTEHSFVLEQVFSWPTSIVDGKAYIGGKNVYNKSGNIVDFLLKNRLTQSAALVEIKTPMSPLLGAKYRGTYNISSELSGSIMQTLNYKHSLQEDFQSLTRGSGDLFDSLNPQCAVIIGNAHRELDHQTKTKAFELFRHQFPGLTVFTFDELFDKARHLINLLENEPDVEEYDDDIPF
ncbi:MAG: DUF4263 domain-containing protein [Candidatus Thiodiazotropha endolucinida]|nr:DUF4263 domain-containing protein [Candidatus Thiodiazotropha endolucinida]